MRSACLGESVNLKRSRLRLYPSPLQDYGVPVQPGNRLLFQIKKPRGISLDFYPPDWIKSHLMTSDPYCLGQDITQWIKGFSSADIFTTWRRFVNCESTNLLTKTSRFQPAWTFETRFIIWTSKLSHALSEQRECTADARRVSLAWQFGGGCERRL